MVVWLTKSKIKAFPLESLENLADLPQQIP